MIDRARRTARPMIASAALVALAASAVACGSDDPTADGPAASLSDAELTGGEGRELADDDVAPLDSGVIVDTEAPATTVPSVGSAAELLPEIGVEISRLSAVLGTQESTESLARVDAMWAAIRDEVATNRPDLLNGIEATIGLAHSAVEEERAADADAAFDTITDLVDSYTGDS